MLRFEITKRREETWKVDEKVQSDSRNLGFMKEATLKWSAWWIGPLPITKILHKDVYILDLAKRVGKNWHHMFHLSLFKKYIKDD